MTTDAERLKRKVLLETRHVLQCPVCKTDEHLIEDGGTVCTECGTVVESQVIDLGAEWHNYDDDGEDKSRVGAAADPLLGDSLSTEIANSKSGSGILRAHISSTKNNPDKNLKDAFSKIDALAEKMDLPSKHKVVAKELFKCVNDDKPVRASKDISGFVAASLYGACKVGDIPRQIKEFVVHTGLDKKTIGKFYKRLEMIIKKHPRKENSLQVGYSGSTPSLMIPRFATSLKLKYPVQRAAEIVAERAVEMGITSGKAPTTVAAAALFMCTQLSSDKKQMKDICDVTGVSEPTVRKCLKDLEAVQSQLVPKDIPL